MRREQIFRIENEITKEERYSLTLSQFSTYGNETNVIAIRISRRISDQFY